jgi:hypothetical protein
MVDNRLGALRSDACTPKTVRRGDFMHKQIDTVCMPYEVLRDSRVARQDHGTPIEVEAIAEGGS